MQPNPSIVRIGTRASKLAQTQTRWVQARVAEALGARPEEADEVAPLVLITTTGDRVQDRRLLEIGGKQLFTKEIEEALLDGRVDMAVHSMKDVPAEQPQGLAIAAVPLREDPRDAFVSRKWGSLAELPLGANIGTASLRRQAQLLAARPDLKISMLRGNVDTRLRKLDEGECDATLLAAAGLNRLDLSEVIRELFDPIAMPPAPGQGALALQTRVADAGAEWLQRLHHRPTELAVAAERGALSALEGSCRTAIGAHATVDEDRLTLVVEALSADGRERWRREAEAVLKLDPAAEAHAVGFALGGEIRAEAGDRLIVG
ncbi:MAG: hydroxymethylbilane synthase [Proteobacteria bacterium]|nr:hydroxymethylbilane synthase [Pseudomonadota bacterium]